MLEDHLRLFLFNKKKKIEQLSEGHQLTHFITTFLSSTLSLSQKKKPDQLWLQINPIQYPLLHIFPPVLRDCALDLRWFIKHPPFRDLPSEDQRAFHSDSPALLTPSTIISSNIYGWRETVLMSVSGWVTSAVPLRLRTCFFHRSAVLLPRITLLHHPLPVTDGPWPRSF